jgi:hypothetical protein
MGATGVIRQEFREPLVDLRHRLGVSDDAAKKLFLEAVKEKMAPMIEWIVLELERTILTPAQLSQKRQKDFGEDYFKTGKGASVSVILPLTFSISMVRLCHLHLQYILLGDSWNRC